MIEIVKCGALITVQDAGRFGYRHLGVAQSGVMDSVAFQQANMLLGNALDAAVLEVALGPLHLKFHDSAAIVLLGADFNTRLVKANESKSKAVSLSPGFVHLIPAGSIVQMQRPLQPGMSALLAIAGGFAVPTVMGSCSTDLSGKFGGHAGRALQVGDRLEIGVTLKHSADKVKQGIRAVLPGNVLRAIKGPDYPRFTEQACADFWRTEWRVSLQSNRMGMRLTGTTLPLNAPMELSSAGVMPGVVQVPKDGLPIILGKDAQTIGGYPRIASVIASDLWQLAYLPAGSLLLFEQVSLQQAYEAAARSSASLERQAKILHELHKLHELHRAAATASKGQNLAD